MSINFFRGGLFIFKPPVYLPKDGRIIEFLETTKHLVIIFLNELLMKQLGENDLRSG